METAQVQHRPTGRLSSCSMTKRTTKPGSESTNLKVRDPVRIQRTIPATGSWKKYQGRTGWVSAINHQTFPDGSTYVEIGVSWLIPSQRNPSTDVWFRADEVKLMQN